MNLLAVLASDEFKRDANAAEEHVRRRCAGTATVAPQFDYKDGQVAGWRFVITSSKTFNPRGAKVLPSQIAS